MADNPVPPAETRAPAQTVETSLRYLEWGPIIAGAAMASALSLVLFSFAASVGLSLVSAEPSRSYGRFAANLVAFLALAIPIATLLAGGYLAGRMRTAWGALTSEETQFRDGVHGAIVWGVSMLIGAWIATAVVANSAGSAGTALSNASTALAPSVVDTLARPNTTTPSTPAGEAASPRASAELRDEIGRILLAAAQRGTFDQNDRQYLVQTVARQTGVPPEEIERRVQKAFDDTVAAAEKARRATVAAGLIAGIAAMLGLAAAWTAAQCGGRHRDNNVPARISWDMPYRVVRAKP